MPTITPIQGDQIALPLPKPVERYWLRVDHAGNTYTYDECKKVFTLEDWDAKPFPSVGRARASIYALRNHKQLKKELAGAEIYVYNAITRAPVDTFPPEPEPETPLDEPAPLLTLLSDNDKPLPWADETPLVSALKQRCAQLSSQIESIRRSGAVAPSGCSMEAYTVTKKLSGGKKERFRYYRMKSEGAALFQNQHGQSTKSLHLGADTSVAYKDWSERVKRRNAIALLERWLDKAEREKQKTEAK